MGIISTSFIIKLETIWLDSLKGQLPDVSLEMKSLLLQWYLFRNILHKMNKDLSGKLKPWEFQEFAKLPQLSKIPKEPSQLSSVS